MSGKRHTGWRAATGAAVALAFAGCGDDNGAGSQDPLITVHTDAVTTAYEGCAYVISRSGVDNLMKLAAPAAPSITCYLSDYQSEAGLVSVDIATRAVTPLRVSSMAYETPLGSSVNGHHIGFISASKAYLTQYGSDQLLIINPSTGASTGTVDLATFGRNPGTDSAGLPFMDKAAVYGQRCYVACQRLAGWTPVVNGVLAVIDAATDSVTDSIRLAAMNPGDMHVLDGKLYVSQTGLWTNDLYETVLDGGIECIDLADGSSDGMVLEEQAAGGNISTFVMVSQTRAYVMVAQPDWTNAILEFNPATHAITDTVDVVGNACGTLVYHEGMLYVADRGTGRESLLAIDPSTNTLSGDRIPLELPPADIAL